MLDFEHAVDGEGGLLAFCNHRLVVPGTHVLDKNPCRLGGGVGAGLTGCHQLAEVSLQALPGLGCGFGVEAGFAECLLVVEHHRSGEGNRQGNQAVGAVDRGRRHHGRGAQGFEALTGILHDLVQRTVALRAGEEAGQITLTQDHQVREAALVPGAVVQHNLGLGMSRVVAVHQLLQLGPLVGAERMHQLDVLDGNRGCRGSSRLGSGFLGRRHGMGGKQGGDGNAQGAAIEHIHGDPVHGRKKVGQPIIIRRTRLEQQGCLRERDSSRKPRGRRPFKATSPPAP